MIPSVTNFKAIAVYGNVGSGKTALCYKIARQFKSQNKTIYFLKHPKPELIRSFGYNNLFSLSDLSNLTDCLVIIDEPQLLAEFSEYKRDMILSRILSLARQRDITLIIASSDTRTFNKRVEAYFDCWIVKDIEYSATKQRSKLREVLKKNCIIMPEEVILKDNEFLLDNRKNLEINGKHTFELIDEWSDKLSKPYK